MKRLSLLIVTSLATLSGCKPGGTADAGASTQSSYLCTVDPALLSKGGDCLFDDSCPCGSFCKQGACTFDCRADADCASGQACDGFGRCVKVAVNGFAKGSPVAAPVSGAPQGTVSLSGVPVELAGIDTVGAATLIAGDGGVTSALLKAGAGVELQCAEGGAFSASCQLDGLAGGSQAIGVRVVDASKSGAYDVQVTTPAQSLSFRVRYTKDTVVTPSPLEGTYEGFARLTALGSSARTVASPIPAALGDLSIPIKMTVYTEAAGARVVELSDAFGVLFPTTVTVAELLRDSNGNLQLRLTPRAFVQVASQGVDVAMSAQSTSFEKALSGLTLTLRSRYAGVIDDPSAPYVQWQLSLARTGDLAANAVAPQVPAAYTPGAVAARATQPFAVESAVLTNLKASTLATPALQAQAVLCTPAGAAVATRFGTSISAPSWAGDLACTGGGATPAEQLAFGIIKDTVWQVGPTVQKCIVDLRGGLVSTDGAGCINQGRAVTALATALDPDRKLALGTTVTADAPASAIAHRVTQQWLRTHLFVAKQATQIDLLNDVLTTEAQVARTFQQPEMLDLTGHAFDLLLHPRIAMGLSRLNPQVVFAPDYRPMFAPGAVTVPNPRHEQPDGLPVTLVDALQDDLGVYAALYDRARFVPNDRAALETSARQFLRKSLVLGALASAINDNARANNTQAPLWDAKWTRALGQYGTGFAGLLRNIENLRAGRNPLDIDDQLDLPLYRVGDQVGALNRFSAVSDYLLGTGTSLDNSAIVPAKLLEASAALDAARAAVVSNLSQDFAAAQEDAARAGRLEAIRRKYGEQVQSLCGDPSLNANTVLLQSDLDPETCFVKPECRLSPTDRLPRLAPGDVARSICIAVSATQRLGSGTIPGFTTGSLGTFLPLLTRQTYVVGQQVNAARATLDVQTTGGTLVVPLAAFSSPTARIGTLPAEVQESMRVTCDALARFTELQRPAVTPQACSNNGECVSGEFCDTTIGHCHAVNDVAQQTACYMGALGELTVALRSGAKDIEIARSEMDELTQSYNLQMRKCIIQSTEGDAQVAALRAHNDTMHAMASAKLAFDLVTVAAESVAACATSTGSDNKFGVAGTVACVADGVALVSKSVSTGLQFGMDEAVRNHELASKKLEVDAQKQTCQVEADMTVVGMNTAVLRVQRAVQEMSTQFLQLDNQKNAVRVALRDGREALQAETDRAVTGIAMDFWLSDKVELYGSAFRAARRAAYLGVLAVEYEYQVSTIERQNVLAATTVAQLKGVLDRLRNLVATGTVRGRAPANLHSVVSVRSNLLQLADASHLPAGWHTLTDAQRFQLLLTSPRFAVYDQAGQYQGQELPFSVAPLAALALGNAGGVPLLSSSDCSERVWSVNATLAGTDLMAGEGTRPRVTLKKRNRFYSQWCTPAPNTTQFQVDATRPSRNLFLDPFTDYLPGRPGSAPSASATIDAAAEADAFAVARLQPQLNVTRADFETDQFFNGSSTELAGRGLYGDYALFFPADALALGGAGLKLEHLEDVLLRFDYVSVAQ